MSNQITPDQYRVAALLDIVADNARREAEALMNERLKHAVALQEAKASAEQSYVPEPAPVEEPAQEADVNESETSPEV